MTMYVDHWGDHQALPTVQATDKGASAKVTYRGDDGQRFRVIVHQKPNPIGFTARLPGDAPRPKPGC